MDAGYWGESAPNAVESLSPEGEVRALASTPWPMFHYDLRHTGLSPHDTSENTGELLWRTAGGDGWSSPAIGSDGTIYVGSLGGSFHAVDPEDGNEAWNLALAGPFYSSPAVASDGTIYAGTFGGLLYAIEASGGIRWTVPTGRIFLSSPAIGPDGTIYVGAEDNRLYAVNPNGTVRWTFPTDHWVDSSPAIGPDGTIYFGSNDNRLYAVSPSGSELWSFSVPSYPIQSSPAIGADGTIYVGAGDGNVYALSPSGTKLWSFSTGPGAVISSPAIDSSGMIYVGASMGGYVYAIRPNGTMAWRFETGAMVLSSPAIGADGTIFVGSEDYNLYALNPNGTERWRFRTGGWVSASPAIAACGGVYFGSSDGNLYAIGPRTCRNSNYLPVNPNPGERSIVGLSLRLTMSVNVANSGAAARVPVTLAFYNASTPSVPFATFGVPPLPPGGTEGPFQVVWMSPAVPGTYEVVVEVDRDDAVAESNESDNLHTWTIDVRPGPVTDLVIGVPSYTADSTFITSSTALSFSVLDRGDVGIRMTAYRTDGGPWADYAGDFSLAGEGRHLIEWHSEDGVSNFEATRSAFLLVDDTPPTTTPTSGPGTYPSGSAFELIATDARSGVAGTEYRVDEGSWIAYDSPFLLPSGNHIVGFRSTDHLDNREPERTLAVRVISSPTVSPANWKPLVAASFAVLLALVGAWSARRTPWQDGTGRAFRAFMYTSVPFVVAEVATGVVSLVTGFLSIPPLVGPGTAVDLTILIAGVLVSSYRARRGTPS